MSYRIQQSTARNEGRCKTWSCCGLDEPLANYTSDHDEGDSFFDIQFPPDVPDIPLGQEWSKKGCLFWCFSSVSQAAADRCAELQEVLCADPVPEIFLSDPQTCSINCEYGGTFTASVPGSQFFSSLSASEANARAKSLCESLAAAQNICITGDLDKACFMYHYYDSSITIAGTATPASASIISGALPTGITMSRVGSQLVFLGVPAQSGSFEFVVMVTTTVGNYVTRQLTMCVMRILTPDLITDPTPSIPWLTTQLPDAELGANYFLQFEALGCSGKYTWRLLVAGTMPPGISINQAGRMSGRPSVLGTYDFIIEVEDGTEGLNPPAPVPAVRPAGLLAEFAVSPETPLFPCWVDFLNNTTGKGHLTYLWDFGDGTTSTERNPTHYFNTDGSRPPLVTLTAYDGYISDSYSLYIGTGRDIRITGFDTNDFQFTVFDFSSIRPYWYLVNSSYSPTELHDGTMYYLGTDQWFAGNTRFERTIYPPLNPTAVGWLYGPPYFIDPTINPHPEPVPLYVTIGTTQIQINSYATPDVALRPVWQGIGSNTTSDGFKLHTTVVKTGSSWFLLVGFVCEALPFAEYPPGVYGLEVNQVMAVIWVGRKAFTTSTFNELPTGVYTRCTAAEFPHYEDALPSSDHMTVTGAFPASMTVAYI